MGLAWSKAGVTSNAEEFLRDQLEPGERIEVVAFGNTSDLGFTIFSRGHTLCLTDRRLFALRCRYLTGIPVELAWAEPHGNVVLEHFGKGLNTGLELRPLPDGETLKLVVGRPYNDEGARIAAVLGAAQPAEASPGSS